MINKEDRLAKDLRVLFAGNESSDVMASSQVVELARGWVMNAPIKTHQEKTASGSARGLDLSQDLVWVSKISGLFSLRLLLTRVIAQTWGQRSAGTANDISAVTFRTETRDHDMDRPIDSEMMVGEGADGLPDPGSFVLGFEPEAHSSGQWMSLGSEDCLPPAEMTDKLYLYHTAIFL
jgi:hypothetical protein